MKQTFLLGCVAVALLYVVFSWYRIVTTSAPDFSVYYEAARRLEHGGVLYGEAVGFTGFSYPPQTALFFLPFTEVSYRVAQAMWVTFSIILVPIMGLIGMALIHRPFRLHHYILVVSLCFLSFPTKYTLGMGQVNILSLSTLLLGLYFLEKQRLWWGSMLIGISIVLKPQSIILLIPLLLKGRFKEVGIIGLIGLLMTLFVVAAFGLPPFESYIHTELPILFQFSGRDIYYNQSVSAVTSRISPLYLAQMISAVCSLGILGAGIWIVRKKSVSFLTSVFFFMPIFLLIQPITWQHHGVYVLPSLLVLWFTVKNRVLRVMVVLSYLLISANIAHPEWFTSSYILRATLLSHMFWGMLLAYGVWMGAIGKGKISLPRKL